MRLWILTTFAVAALLFAAALTFEPIDSNRWLTVLYFLPSVFGIAFFADIGISTYTALKYPSALGRYFLLRRVVVGASALGTSGLGTIFTSSYLSGEAFGDQAPFVILILGLIGGGIFSPIASKMARVVFGAKYF